MVRIAGVDLPNNKRVEVALTYIHGIGPSSSRRILMETGVSPDIRMHELSDEDLNKVRRAIESDYKVEGALRTEVSMNIKRLMDIGSYRGVRHQGAAGAWAADAYERADAEGSATHSRREEEGAAQVAVAPVGK